MVTILVSQCNSLERSHRLAALKWVSEFIQLGKTRSTLCNVLPCCVLSAPPQNFILSLPYNVSHIPVLFQFLPLHKHHPIPYHPILSHTILSHPPLSYPIPQHPIPSPTILSHPQPSYIIPNHPISSPCHPTSSYLIPHHPIRSPTILSHPRLVHFYSSILSSVMFNISDQDVDINNAAKSANLGIVNILRTCYLQSLKKYFSGRKILNMIRSKIFI
jgi:hypothetical protein